MFHKHGLGDTAGGPAYAMEHFGHLWDFSDWISRFWPITAVRDGQQPAINRRQKTQCRRLAFD